LQFRHCSTRGDAGKTFAKAKGDCFFALEFIHTFHDRLQLVRGGAIEWCVRESGFLQRRHSALVGRGGDPNLVPEIAQTSRIGYERCDVPDISDGGEQDTHGSSIDPSKRLAGAIARE
jgi:hypothetical protein